jgi:hypothetical protein
LSHPVENASRKIGFGSAGAPYCAGPSGCMEFKVKLL